MHDNHDQYNPYHAPDSELDEYDDCPPLYNPQAVALWSILFTPFGAWFHAKNWQALEEDELAQQNLIAFWLMIAWIFAVLVLDMLTGIALPTAVSAIVPLVVWHLKLGKQQVEYVKEYFGDDYPRQSLVFVMLFGILGGYVVMFTLSYILMTLFGMLGILHSSWL